MATAKKIILLAVCLLAGVQISAVAGSNIMVNGSCEDPENPWKHWTYDYAETQNQFYVGNRKFISMLPSYGGKKNVIKIQVTKATALAQGVMVDSPLIPFEQGCRYRFTVSIQSSGAEYHIYVIGYQWKPGIKPYDNPSLFDLRPRYKGTFNSSEDGRARGGSWTRITRDFPDKQLSSLAMQNIKDVRMMSMHFFGVMGVGDLYVKDLCVEKLPDKYSGGKITDDDRRTTTKKSAK